VSEPGLDGVVDHERARRELSAAESRYRILAELCADFVIEATVDGIITWISPGILDLTGRTPESLIGRPTRLLWDPDDVADRTEFYDQIRTHGRGTHIQRIAHVGGSARWTKVAARAVVDGDGDGDGDGTIAGYIGSGIDIQAEIDARNALAASEERFRLIAELASDIVMRFDEADVVQWVSPSVTAVLGWTPEQVVGRSITSLIHPSETARVPYVDTRTAQGASVAFEGRLRTADGRYRWFDVSVRPVLDGDGRVTGHVSGLHDIDDAVRARDELEYQATHDPLTHVANRADLYAHIDELLGHQPRTGDRVGVLFLDVDRLKSINDTHGHAAGDAVLIAVADRIRGAVRAADVVARFGGDEFIVVLASLHGVEDAERVSDKIHAAMAAPVAAGAHTIPVSVSIGIAIADAHTDPDVTLQHADAALYRAKARGRGKTAAHRPDA